MSGGATLHFLPWMRRGLARSIAQPASNGLPAAGAGTVDAAVTVDRTVITQAVRLRGPGEIVGLAATHVVREDPPAGTQDFERNYFPSIELAAPDLPWMFTPARAGADDKLVPWLALVVVEHRDGVLLSTRATAPLPVLTIGPPADARDELPDPAEAWAWAHVQTAASLEGRAVGEAYAAEPETFLARLVAPRRLEEHRSYIACVVPVFAAGRQAGLGLAAVPDDVGLAWSPDDQTVELPVYHSWTFRTGPDGDFEALVRRLTPRELDAGAHDLDVGDPGSDRLPRSPGTLVSFRGALVSPAAHLRTWKDPHRSAFQRDMRVLLNEALSADGTASPARYDPLVHDPVVAPPAYGALPAGKDQVPEPWPDDRDGGPRPWPPGGIPVPGLPGDVVVPGRHEPRWLADVNLDPATRGAGGLGAEVVRRDQEPLMASAWAQATSLREINRLLNWTRLAGEAGTRFKAGRLGGLTDGAILQWSGPAHTRIRGTVTTQTVRGQLRGGGVPAGLVTAAFRRIARRGGTVDRALAGRGRVAEVSASVAERFVTDLAGSLEFAAYVRPFGVQMNDASLLDGMPGVDPSDVPRPASLRTRRRAAPRAGGGSLLAAVPRGARRFAVGTPASILTQDGFLPDRDVIPTDLPGGVDLTGLARVADAVRAGLDPVGVLSAKLRARVTAPASAWGADQLPAAMTADPAFPEPLYESLRRLDPEFLLPGVGEIPDDTVGLTEVNAAFVEAFLLGANHELTREFLWREYPADLSHTWLRTFWDAIEAGAGDIAPVADWGGGRLGQHQIGPGAGGTLVVVVKGALLRRYPDTVVYATRARWSDDRTEREEDDGATAERRDPLFVGRLDRSTSFLGFALDADEARGDPDPDAGQAGWFFVFEQPPAGPRFGLDRERAAHAAKTPGFWKNVSWGHQVEALDALGGLPYARATGRLAGTTRRYDEGAFQETWGEDAAAMARITLQRPVRMLVHATAMLPAATEASRGAS